MTPEQRAALVEIAAQTTAHSSDPVASWRSLSESGRAYFREEAAALAAIEAAGYTILAPVPTPSTEGLNGEACLPCQHRAELINLRWRVYSQRIELARLHSQHEPAIATARAAGRLDGRLDGAQGMREACAKTLRDEAAQLRRDAEIGRSVGMSCSDSGGSLEHYADLFEGRAENIEALPLPGDEP